MDVAHIGFIYILLQYSIVRSIKAVQFVECSNELSAHFAVQHLDVALLSVPHHICSIKNSFDLRCESVTCVHVHLFDIIRFVGCQA